MRLPDLATWSTVLGGSSVTTYPYITEFIARLHGGADMSDTTPYLRNEVGYAPYSTLPILNLDATTINGI